MISNNAFFSISQNPKMKIAQLQFFFLKAKKDRRLISIYSTKDVADTHI